MMKSFLFLVLSCLPVLSIAHTMDPPSTHGMAVIGRQKIYLSHLPMFHSPHDYQVILEVTLDASAQTKYQDFRSSSPDGLVTMVPETFVLPEMVAHPHPFKAAFYKGHFERGGTTFIDEAVVTITKVIYFKKFSPTDTKPTSAHDIVFGNSAEQFLAHEITAKPDFDHLVRVKFQGPLDGQIIELSGHANDQPLQVGEKPNQQVEILSSLYLEFDDLSM